MVKFFNIFFLVAIVVLFIYLFKKNSLERVVSDEEYHYINEPEAMESKRKYQENEWPHSIACDYQKRKRVCHR